MAYIRSLNVNERKNELEESEMKKTYKTPVADLLRFDYTESVVAASNAGANPAQCGPQNWGHCKDKYLQKPAECYGDDASHCVHA